MRLRIVTLLVVLANIGFNYAYVALGAGPSMDEVSDRTATFFTPAHYAFGIWGLIYLAFAAFAIGQLGPSQRHRPAYEALDPVFLALNLALSLWIVLFTHEHYILSVLVIGACLGLALWLLFGAHRLAREGLLPAAVIVPMALVAGWLSVASLANLAVTLVQHGLEGSSGLAMVLLAVAGGAGSYLAFRLREVIVPVVVAWAAVAIWAADREDAPTTAVVALAVAAIQVLVAVVVVGSRLGTPRRAALR